MLSLLLPANPLRVPVALVLLCALTAASAAPVPIQTQTTPEITQQEYAATARIERNLEHAIAKMQPLVERYGYAGVAAAVSVEGFGLPAPGQTLLMAAALEAAREYLHITLLFVLAVAAAFIGNSLGYLLGKLGGRPLLRKLRVNQAREEKIAAQFERYGGGIVLLARFFDGPRQLNGIIAGTLGMRWWVFTVFNLLGALLWVAVWGLGTYYLYEHLQAVDTFIRSLNPWVVGVAIIAVMALILYLLRGRPKPLSTIRPN
ncbi:MAG: hypothetical protein N838_05900 [Thiohalocapsa sp. PB-PSB1]|jgi:membrane protein DedA with SNARE-associated domain|nr:MAG: hypothetical protein N838_05900 [Thiohalocapsa sp. PB-PSB1]